MGVTLDVLDHEAHAGAVLPAGNVVSLGELGRVGDRK